MKHWRNLAQKCVFALAFGTALTGMASDPTAPRLRGRFETLSDGSSRKFVLEWDAVSNATYQVQAATDLNPGTPWKTIDVILPTANPGICSIAPEKSEASSESLRFFRLGLPQPEIFAIEPALLPAGVESTVYVVGQCFSDNMELRVGPRALTNREIINPNLMRVAFTPASEGTYVFELVVADRVVHTFTVFAVDLAGNRDQLAQEVPDFPPASPAKVVNKGKVTGSINVMSANRVKKGGVITGGIVVQNGNRIRVGQRGNYRSKTTGTKVVLGGIKTSEESFRAGEDFDNDDEDDGSWAVAIPAFMKNARKAKTSEATVNLRSMNNWPGTFQVQPFSAELQHQVVDMVFPGVGIDLVWGRCYRSQTGPNTAMGNGWTHFYDIRVEQSGADLVLHDGTGRRDLFIQQPDGTYRRDGFFYEITRDSMNRVKVKFPWLGEWDFKPFDGSTSAGKISSSRDASGNTITFAYDGGGFLTEIIDTLGRIHRIGYIIDSTGQPVVSSFTDSQGRVIRYTLSDSTRDLVSVRTPPVTGTPNGNDFINGKTTTYFYTQGFTDDRLNHNLVRVADPSGQTWLQVVYRTNELPSAVNFDAVDFVQRGPYRSFLRRVPILPAPENNFAVVKAIINDAGNVSELSYDVRNRCVLQLDFTGRASPDLPTGQGPTQNRPTGKLRPCDSMGDLSCDPDVFETRAHHNRDHLCTSLTLPRGNSVHYVYGRDFDKNINPRKTGDLLVVRERPVINALDPDSDDDGVLDSIERVWRFEVDPRFGSPPLALFAIRKEGEGNPWIGDIPAASGFTSSDRGKNPSRVAVALDNSVWVGNRLARPAINEGLFITDAFLTRATDPLGNVAVLNYDAAGNCLTVQFNPKEISVDRHLAWNARGQLTAITNAPDGDGFRRIDTFEYFESGVQEGRLKYTMFRGDGEPVRCEFAYDPRGNVTRIIDPRGFSTDMVYNQLDQLLEVQVDSTVLLPRLRIGSTFRYDANDNLVQIDHENRNENGVLDPANPQWTTQCRYDALDRMTDCWVDKDGSLVLICEQVAYDAHDNVVLYRSPEAVNGHDPNALVRFEYDERNMLFRTTPAPGTGQGATVQWDYDPNGNLAKIDQTRAEPNARIETRAYDGFDRLISVIDPMGNEAKFAYDDNNNCVMHKWFGEREDGPIGVANLRYHEWRWRYNSRDLLVSSHEAHLDPATQKPIGDGESTHTFTYAPNGQLLSERDDNGHTTRYTYDTLLRLSSVIDPRTNTVTFAYDPSGNLISVTEIDRSDLAGPEQRFTRTYDYDPLGRLTGRTDNIGNTENWQFDSRGNCVRAVDAAGNTTAWTYDGLNRVTLAIADLNRDGALDVADASRTYVWDDNSRLSSETDDNGNTTVYAYDALNRRTLATSPDGTIHRFVWDSRSELVSHTDPNGTVFNNHYDLLSRRARTDIVPGAGVAATTTFEEFRYNGRSELVSARNDVSLSTFEYDSHGNCLRHIQDGWEMLKAFDAEGNKKSFTYPGGTVLQYSHDSLNRVNELECTGCVAPSGLSLASFAYDGPDRISRLTRANGVNTRIAWNGFGSSQGQPGDQGWKQVSRIRHSLAGGAASVHQLTNRYDGAQNRVARDNHLQGAVDVIQALRFGYDGANRLVQSLGSTDGIIQSETMYHLDGNGNRVFVASDGLAMNYVMESTQPPADFQMDQYTSTPFGREEHDANGNRVSGTDPARPVLSRYDCYDRLVSVGPAIAPVVDFAYDALGHRIRKTTYTSTTPSVPITTSYIHDCDDDCDGWDDIIEERTAGRAPVVYNKWPLTTEVVGKTEKCTFRPLTIEVVGKIYYYHQDELGSVLALTDATGRVVERYDYGDYGEPTFLSSDGVPLLTPDGLPVTASPLGNRFLFRGMEWDSETALYRSRRWEQDPYAEDAARFYDPKTGRYTTRARGIIKGNNGPRSSKARGIIRSNNGNSTKMRDIGVSKPGGAIYSAFTYANNNPGSPSQLTGRPVGQPAAAGLGRKDPNTGPYSTRARGIIKGSNGSTSDYKPSKPWRPYRDYGAPP